MSGTRTKSDRRTTGSEKSQYRSIGSVSWARTINPLITQWVDDEGNTRRGWGCTKVSPGCANCYAEKVNRRFGSRTKYNTAEQEPHELVLDLSVFDYVRGFPSIWFVGSQTDIWQERATDQQIDAIVEKCCDYPDHFFVFLTKRAERMSWYFLDADGCPANVWAGVSIESPKYLDRLQWLRNVPTRVRIVSVEPMLKPFVWGYALGCKMPPPDWVIFGGETGSGSRPCDVEAMQRGVEACQRLRIPTYVKSWGANPRLGNGKVPPADWYREPTRQFPWCYDGVTGSIPPARKHAGAAAVERSAGKAVIPLPVLETPAAADEACEAAIVAPVSGTLGLLAGASRDRRDAGV